MDAKLWLFAEELWLGMFLCFQVKGVEQVACTRYWFCCGVSRIMRSSCIEDSEVGQCGARARSGFTFVVDDDEVSVGTCVGLPDLDPDQI